MRDLTVELREILEILIQMRDVLKDLTWHRRLGKKLIIAGDLGRIKNSVTTLPLAKVHKEDADGLIEALDALESAIESDKYIVARKKLEASIRSAARLIADREIDAWRKG